MIQELSQNLKKLFSEKKEITWKIKPLTSSFQSVAHYYLDSFPNARIHIKNVIPYKFKHTTNFKKEDIYIVVTTNKTIEKSIVFDKDEIKLYGRDALIERGLTILQTEIVKELDKECLFLMSDMGRITASAYGQIKQTIGNFTLSESTNTDAIMYRLSFCDSVLKEINNIGLKHLVISKFIYDKLQDFIEDEYIVVNHKRVTYECLSDSIDKDPLCLIATSQNKEDLTPGIVSIYNDMNVKIEEHKKTLTITLSQDYALEKIGLKAELYYIRFLQT